MPRSLATQQRTSFFLLYSLLSLTGLQSASANVIAWQDQIPSALAPFQQQASVVAGLAQNNILFYAHPPQQTHVPTLTQQPYPKVQFHSAAIVLPVAHQEIAKALQDYRGYVGLYPTLTQAKPLYAQDNIQQMHYRIEIPTPIPILNFKQNIRFQHHAEANAIRSLILDAPIPYGLGKIEWFALAPKRTLVTITQWGDLNQPQGFLMRKILSALPDAKKGLPTATNGFILEALRQRFGQKTVTALPADQWPNVQLSAQQQQRLLQHMQQTGQPVSFMHAPTTVRYAHGAEMMRFATTYQYYPSGTEHTKSLLSPELFKTLFPRQVKGIEHKRIDETQQFVHYKLGVSLGVISIPFDIHLRYQQLDPLHIRYDAAATSDLKYIKGEMKLKPEGKGSVLTLTSAAKVDAKAPFLLRAARSLPYHDVLPALTSNSIVAVKSKEKLNDLRHK